MLIVEVLILSSVSACAAALAVPSQPRMASLLGLLFGPFGVLFAFTLSAPKGTPPQPPPLPTPPRERATVGEFPITKPKAR